MWEVWEVWGVRLKNYCIHTKGDVDDVGGLKKTIVSSQYKLLDGALRGGLSQAQTGKNESKPAPNTPYALFD